MKKLIALAIAAIAITTFADKATFPYDVSPMTSHFATNSAVTVSDETVSLPGTETLSTDTIAKLVVQGVTLTAVDAGDWDEFVKDLSGVAMLAVKVDGAATNWYGYTSNGWVSLDGAVDLSTTYTVEIDFDKTAGNKIRYAVTPAGGSQIVLGTGWLGQTAWDTLKGVDIVGTGSITSADLTSGARPAYANVTSIEQDYAFDYDNVKFKVVVGDGVYGENAKIRVTLSDGVNNKVVDQALNGAGTYNIDFSNENLVKGASYNCTVQVVADDIAADDITSQTESQVKLFVNADWFGFDTAFVKATATNATISDGKFSPTDDEQPVVVTPTKASEANSRSTVEIDVDYTDAYADIGADITGAQSALALTAEGWKCLSGGEWTAITNANVGTAQASYKTRAEFDYTGNSHVVKFSIYANEQWNVMESVADSSVKTFALAGSETKLNGTSFLGGGKISAIAANFDSFGGVQPEIDGSTITIGSSADVDLANLSGTYTIAQSSTKKKYPMKWTDATGKRAKIVNGQLVVENQDPANGMQSYHSYVLGLNTADANSKPVLDSVQNDDTDTLTLKVPNVNVNTDAADVTMQVIEKTSPTATEGTPHDFTDGAATITLDPNNGARYYEVKFTIKTK